MYKCIISVNGSKMKYDKIKKDEILYNNEINKI